MANVSIYNAFERMWQHIVRALGTKVSFTEAQELTDEQKAQVRANIGAYDDDVYVQAEEPIDAPDGSVWVDMDEVSGGTLSSGNVPTVTHADNDKIIQVVNGEYVLVTIENSSIKNYIDNYINEALGGDY